MEKNTDKLVIESTGKYADVALPDMDQDEIAAWDGKEVVDQEGREYILRYRVNKDLGDGDVIKNLEAEQKSASDSLHLGKGAEIGGKWDPYAYLDCLYGNYLDLVNKSDFLFSQKMSGEYNGKIYDEFSCFEDFCQDCLDHLKDQLKLFQAKLRQNAINNRQYQNVRLVLDACTEALRKFLEGEIKF